MYKAEGARKPLIHCITNPIAMNQSANAVLALGARPIMAEHPLEVAEITETADALLLNLGNISDVRMDSMEISIAVANKKDIPVVVDAVGVACSKLRRDFLMRLLMGHKSQVIKGNYSEIFALFNEEYKSSGVDAIDNFSSEEFLQAILHVSERYNSIILATGPEDLIVYEGNVVKVSGGSRQLSTVTGTGCMLGAIVATELAFDNSIQAVERGCHFFKKCGEKAETEKGGGTFMVNLLDAIGEKDGF